MSELIRLLVMVMVVLVVGSPAAPALDELGLAPEIRDRMDDWERRQLVKAEDIYFGRDEKAAKSKKRWALSVAAFDGFINEFPRSNAIPYALYLMGRSYHHDNKLNQARTAYDDLLQFFPDKVTYAAAAAYHKGASFKQQSDDELAMKAWAVIAKTPAYLKEPIAAGAIVELADHAWSKDKFSEAVKFFRMVALEFMDKNRKEAETAVDRVLEYYIRIDPNEPELRKFYHENRGWHRRSKSVPDIDKLGSDQEYWKRILERIDRHGRFDQLQKDQMVRFYSYWADQLEGKNPKWDEFQYDFANYRFAATGDRKAWFAHLDKQYDQYQEAGDNRRTYQWMRWYSFSEPKLKEYYAKLDFDGMDFDLTYDVLRLLYDHLASGSVGSMVAGKFKLNKLSDAQKAKLAQFLYRKDKEFALNVVRSMGNDDEMNWTLLGLVGRDPEVPLEERLAIADKLAKSEKYAGEASWIKGEILEEEKQYMQAIPAYFGASHKGAEMAFAVARCQMSAGNVDKAIAELSAGENMFKKEAHGFAWQAQAYQEKAGRKTAMIQTLRRILMQYKGTSSHSKAHVKLEGLGEDIQGAEENDR